MPRLIAIPASPHTVPGGRRTALRTGVCRAALLAASAATAGVSVVPAAQAQIAINTYQNTQQNLDVQCAGVGAGCAVTVTANVIVPATTALAGNGAINNLAITNSATISGAGGGGILLDNNGSVTNQSGGQIKATGAAAYAVNFQGPSGTLTNSGTVGAVYFFAIAGSKIVTNNAGGAIGTSADARAIQSFKGLTLTNAGSITGKTGVYVSGLAGTITNTGTITGTTGNGITFGNFNNTLTNGGTISGASGTAVQFGNGNNTLILQTGSSFTGNVVGGAGTNNLILQGTGTLPTGLTNFNANLTLQGTKWDIPVNQTFSSVTVTTGNLAVDSGATLTGPVTIASGGTLSGHGSVVGAVTNNGGTVAPGGSIGTLTVTGNYTQNANGTLLIELSPTAASKLAVTGSATLAGTVAVIANPGTYVNKTSYQILTATGGVTGTFSSVVLNSGPLGLSFTASYLANEVDLIAQITGFGTFGTPNQRAAGVGINTAAATATGTLATAITALAALPTQAQILTGVDQIGGSAEGYGDLSTAVLATGRATTGVVGQQMALMHGDAAGATTMAAVPGATRVQLAALDPVAALAQGAAPSVVATPWTAWLSGMGLFGGVNGNGNAHTLNYTTGGTVVGADYRVDPALLVGGFAGYASIGTGTTGLIGTGTVNSYSFGGYASYTADRLYVDGVLGYAYNDETLTRTIGFAGVPTTTARGALQGDQLLASLETGRAYPLSDGFVTTPFLALQASVLKQAAATETGAGTLDLMVNSQNPSTVRSVLGNRLDRAFDVGIGAPVNVDVKLAWAHELSDTARPVTASFVGIPTSSFTVQAAQARRDSALVGIGVASKLDASSSLYVRYEGDINGHDDAHAVIGGVRFTW